MKILMICDFFQESQSYQENSLAKYYLKKGYKVTILASTTDSIFDYYNGVYDKAILPKTYFVSNLKVVRLKYSINILNRIRCLKGLSNAINDETPDIIYVHGIMINLFEAVRYKSFNNCKIIYDSHADLSNSGTNWLSLNIMHRIFYRFIIKFLYKKIDRIFYITPEGGNFLNKYYGIPHKHMDLLPLGSDNDYINDIKTNYSRTDVRKKLGFKDSDFLVVTGGKLAPIKKTELVIQAMNLVKDNSIHLIIIGKSVDENYGNKLFELSKTNPNIHFLGWLQQEQLSKCLYSSDIAIFPAAQSVLWQQSIGFGLPLIVGDFSVDPKYLNKNYNIIIMKNIQVKPVKVSELLIKLFKDKKLFKEMKNGALETANGFLSYEKIADRSINFNN